MPCIDEYDVWNRFMRGSCEVRRRAFQSNFFQRNIWPQCRDYLINSKRLVSDISLNDFVRHFGADESIYELTIVRRCNDHVIREELLEVFMRLEISGLRYSRRSYERNLDFLIRNVPESKRVKSYRNQLRKARLPLC